MTSVILVVHQSYLMYLPTALRSLQTQLSNHELIIVGNGCQVDMAEAISIPQTNLATACNVGIAKATGKYIVRLDADDWIDSDLVRQEEAYLDAHPEVDAVWCDYVEARQVPSDADCDIYLLEHSPQPVLEHACGAMYRKAVWQALGGYDESLPFQEGYDFWQRFYNAGYIADHLNLPMYIYRKGHSSMSASPEREKVRKMLDDKYG
jgi:Glycosyl transferase family 2